MVTAIKKEIMLPVSELEIGMMVTKLDRPWNETNFLMQGFVIMSQEDITDLQNQCDQVYVQVTIEEARVYESGILGSRVKGSQHNARPKNKANGPLSKKRVNYLNKLSFGQTLEASRLTFRSARDLSRSIMDGIRIGRSIDFNACREVVEEVVDSVLNNPDALRFLSQIKNRDAYTAEHSLNVGILSATFARHVGLEKFEIKNVAMSGLLHDVGKAKVPLDILNKPGHFTPDEARIMASHAKYGRDLLLSLPENERFAIDVAHSHHERIDGKGYPRQLVSHQIPYYAKMVSIADAYDAMTSDRVYGQAKTSAQALAIIQNNSGNQFDSALAADFIKCIGSFPVGSLIEMTTGEVGVVLRSDPENILRPKVLLVRDSSKKPLFPEVVVRMDQPTGDYYEIKEELPNGAYGINLGDLVDRGLKLG